MALLSAVKGMTYFSEHKQNIDHCTVFKSLLQPIMSLISVDLPVDKSFFSGSLPFSLHYWGLSVDLHENSSSKYCTQGYHNHNESPAPAAIISTDGAGSSALPSNLHPATGGVASAKLPVLLASQKFDLFKIKD